MTAVLAAAVVLVSAVVKGVIGSGFPTVATPFLTLFLDVKVAVVVLIVPNIVMDAVQFARRGAPLATVRRFAVLLAAGAVGTVLGTRFLVVLPSRALTTILGVIVLLFVTLNATRLSPRLSPRSEPWLSPIAGLVAGVVGGLTNVPGTPLVIYFYALGLPKHEFLSAIAYTFLVYKLAQLGSVAYYGLLTWRLLGASLALTVVALSGFALGLRVQDRLAPATFNRAVLVFLFVLGIWLIARSVV